MASIHNVMEDLVFTEVNKFYDDLITDTPSWLICACPQCRLDTICYVLNRIKPHYIKSSRGLAHFVQPNNLKTEQLNADIATLIVEGARRVATNKRPHERVLEEWDAPVFNFPAITGRILNGKTFSPVSNIQVSLKIANTLVEQMNVLWDNPYTISEKTAGTFTFLPKYVRATKAGLNEVFPFSISVNTEGYDPLNYYFKIGVQSSDEIQTEISMKNYFRLPDLFLFS
ncbi:MAG: late competence development ComFB family protein [Treponemataceae bacterium]